MQKLDTPRREYKKFNGKKGDVYGRLTLTGKTSMSVAYYKFRRIVEADCECGIRRDYIFNLLLNGDTKSCGCLRKEVSSKKATTHGLTNHLLYDVYNEMLNRCYHENNPGFKNYGGRGIEVDELWQEAFINFYNWSINNGWAEGLQLDRRCNDGNYSPLNCRYVTRAVNNRNRRNNIMITAFGETKCLWDWGIDSRCAVGKWGLRNRYERGKFTDMELMISSPTEERKNISRNSKRAIQLTALGETKCLTAWAEDERCAVGFDRLRDRIAEGMDHFIAITTPQKDSKEINLIAFGETKSFTNWLKDERCIVKRDALRDRYRKGWKHEDCLTIPSKTGFKINKKRLTL